MIFFYQERVEFQIGRALRIASNGKIRSSSEVLWRPCPPDFRSLRWLIEHFYSQGRPARNTALMVLIRYCADLKVDIEDERHFASDKRVLARLENTLHAAVKAAAYLADREWLVYDSARPYLERRIDSWAKIYRETHARRRHSDTANSV